MSWEGRSFILEVVAVELEEFEIHVWELCELPCELCEVVILYTIAAFDSGIFKLQDARQSAYFGLVRRQQGAKVKLKVVWVGDRTSAA